MQEQQDTEHRLTELEVKAGFADDMLDQLNHTIFRQQQQIEFLLRELAELRRQLPAGGAGSAGNLRDELPPHY